MKIVYISSSTIPSRAANSIHVMKMCQAFAKNGHEVILLAPGRKDGIEGFVGNLYAYYGVEQCFEIVNLPWLNIKGRGYIYGALAALHARRMRPDLVFGRNIVGCFFTAHLGLATTFESHVPIEESGRVNAWMFSRLLRSKPFRHLILITDALKQHYLKRYALMENRVFVAPDGADLIAEDTKPADLNSSPGRMQVGYVGHLFAGRGVEVIVALASRCPWADFHLVGGVSTDIDYWQKEVQFARNIIFHGFVAPAQAEKMRIAFDILLSPYQNSVAVMGGKGDTSRWMSPLKVFEYMAAKKPIICSDLPVLREVLQHERNALLCKPDDVDEWILAMGRLRDDKALSERLAQQAYKDFANSYTWRARAEKLLDGSMHV